MMIQKFGIALLMVIILHPMEAEAAGKKARRNVMVGCTNCSTVLASSPHFNTVVTNQAVATYPVQVRAVAALPLSTGYDFAIDSGAYQWRVNQQFFAYDSFIKSMHAAQLGDDSGVKINGLPVDEESLNKLASKIAEMLANGGAIPRDTIGFNPPNDGTSDSDLVSIPYQELDKQMAGVMQANCKKCHQEGHNPKGGLSLFDINGQLKEIADVDIIKNRILSDDPELRMPPKGPLKENDMLVAQRWFSSFVTAEQNENPFSE